MKKTIAFVIAFMYLGLTSGLAVNIHYCMGQIAEVSFDSNDDSGCACNMKGSMPCCKHLYQLVKVEDAHQQVQADFAFTAPVAIIHHVPASHIPLQLRQTHIASSQITDPALTAPPDYQALLSIYRI